MDRGGYICVFEQNKLIINNHMETKHKDLYDAPSTRVFEVKQEGVICQSNPAPTGASIDDYEDGAFSW